MWFSFPRACSVPEDYKFGKSLGPVESLQEHPQCAGKMLIGYSRGLVVLWDHATRKVQNVFLGIQVGVSSALSPLCCVSMLKREALNGLESAEICHSSTRLFWKTLFS